MGLWRRLARRWRRREGAHAADDFAWDEYPSAYAEDLRSIERTHCLTLRPGDYVFEDETLRRTSAASRPLHPNHRLLYETILQCGPASVREFGCGAGDHLANLRTLRPGLVCEGVDISEAQVAFARERHPDLADRVRVHDVSKPLPPDLGPVDLAYTQAVLMHMQTDGNHRRALESMFRTARGTVVLMENWSRHDFLEDARGLWTSGRIPWRELHAHYRESPELGRPHLMVLSSTHLPRYPELTDYSVLASTVR